MHYHPILLVKAENLEDAKSIARDFCDCECGDHSYFDYGGVVPDEETEWNKSFDEVKDKLPEDNHIKEALVILAKANNEVKQKNYEKAGYYYGIAGSLFAQSFCVENPIYNIHTYDYSRECGEGWYAVEADLHF